MLRIGRLNFGTRPWSHGLLGCMSFCITALSLLLPHRWLKVASIFFTTPLAFGSIPLLGHAPKFTPIARGIVAPHREAYKRTISVILYINVRLLFALNFWPLSSTLYGATVAVWAACLFPRGAYHNGNTFIFAMPIFLGIGWDAHWQLRCLFSPGPCP